jgi:hypothetical protein
MTPLAPVPKLIVVEEFQAPPVMSSVELLSVMVSLLPIPSTSSTPPVTVTLQLPESGHVMLSVPPPAP